jgi:hypothetical protein
MLLISWLIHGVGYTEPGVANQIRFVALITPLLSDEIEGGKCAESMTVTFIDR